MAFKLKGFPKHKGTKVHVGNRKGSAVFQRQDASAFPATGDPEKVVTKGDEEWEDWQKGKTTDKEGGETTRTDTRRGTQETTTYTPPSEYDPEWYSSLTKEEQKAADERWRKANTEVTTEDLYDERVEETDPVYRGNLFGRQGTSNIRTGGTGSSVGYTGSMEYDPEQKYGMDQAISSYIPEIYDESGKYKGRGKRVNFKDLEFYNEPEFQQLLTNLNFEMAVSGHGKGAGVDADIDAQRKAQESDYGQALSMIAASDDKQEAYEKVKAKFPELTREGDPASFVNPLQNQGSGSFATSGQARDVASRGSGYKKRRTYLPG